MSSLDRSDAERTARFHARQRGEPFPSPSSAPRLDLRSITPLEVAILYRDGGSLSDSDIRQLHDLYCERSVLDFTPDSS